MPARRDTRREAARVRRLSPLQTVENQSWAWGICCHSCTWREGFTPSWQTELQGSSLPRGLPGSRSFLSTNGSHLNVRGVDHPTALRAMAERLDACWRAIDNAALRVDDATTLVAFDHLGDQDVAPGAQPGPSALARLHGVAKGLPNGPDVRHQAIGTDQQGTPCRTAPHALDQPSDQRHVPLLTDLAAQPQAYLDHHGQRHPDNAALFLDAELIGLHLSQVAWLLDQILVYGLALTARAGPPIRDGTLVEPKRRHDGLHGTPMGQQGHNEDHGLCRGAQPIEDGACGSTEGFVTLVADEPLLLPRMDTDIAHARLASGMAVLIGAKYRRGIHARLLLAMRGSVPRGVCLDPHFRYK